MIQTHDPIASHSFQVNLCGGHYRPICGLCGKQILQGQGYRVLAGPLGHVHAGCATNYEQKSQQR